MEANVKNKGLVSILFITAILLGNIQVMAYQNNKNTRYEHIYKNPPRQSLGAYGRYIISTSGVRYIHSPSRLKSDRHAQRTDANNRMYSYN